MVSGNSIIPYPVRSYFIFSNKKCRIYAACGVSQTPICMKKREGGILAWAACGVSQTPNKIEKERK